MSKEPLKRRLAAIVAADVVGFSRLMERDETNTLEALKLRRREILVPLIEKHDGRLVKVMGDGALIEFKSAVGATQCAIELQARTEEVNAPLPDAERIRLRIGINLGDVLVEGGDLYGDGVNIASRLEGVAEPGGICVSASVYDQVKRKLDVEFEDLGHCKLKNIEEQVRVFRIRNRRPGRVEEKALEIPAKPSIAVLPLTNLSGDNSQDVIADGLTEDLITDLSRNDGLFVIARHSTFEYKNRSIDIRLIARNLGVRYVLEGSIRSAGDRLRINVQLIDAADGSHLWAERFDRRLDDIFEVQDEVVGKIVEELVGKLMPLPIRSRPKSIATYELCVRARQLYEKSPQACREAQLLVQQAILMEPHYAEAHRLLALALVFGWGLFGEAVEEGQHKATDSIRTALQLDPHDANNYWVLGTVMAYRGDWPESNQAMATAIRLDPNNADALTVQSDISLVKGNTKDALEQIQKALRLNPHPTGWYYWVLGQAQYAEGEYDAAVKTLRRPETYGTGSRRNLAASLAQLGFLDDARREAQLFLVSNPHFTISYWARVQPFTHAKTLEHFISGYHMAGLPE